METKHNIEADILEEIDISSLSIGNQVVKTSEGTEFWSNVTRYMSFFSKRPLPFKKNRDYYLDIDVSFLDNNSSEGFEVKLYSSIREKAYSDQTIKQDPASISVRKFIRKNGIQRIFDNHYSISDNSLWIEIKIKKSSPVMIKKLQIVSQPIKPSSGKYNHLLRNDETVSVIIVTYNKRNRVVDLINSMKYLDISLDRLKILVVDNGSNDDTVEALKDLFRDSIDILETGENLGGSGGFIKGMQHVMQNHTSDLIWLIDNDVVVEKKTLSELVRVAKSDDRVGAVGSMMCKLDNQIRINELGGFMDWRNYRIYLNAHNVHLQSMPRNIKQVDYCAATSLLTKREVVEQIGFWDDVFIHFDDVEWCLRMNASGWKVLANPGSKIWHESADVKRTGWMRYYDVRNLLRIYQKYKPMLLKKAIKHFKRQGRYFRLHGFKKTAMMIFSGIKDFKKGKTGKGAVSQETTQHLAKLPPNLRDKKKYYIFRTFDSFCRTVEKLPFGYISGETVFIYEKINPHKAYEIVGVPFKAVTPRKRGTIYKAIVYVKQLLATRGINKIVFIEGSFEKSFIPPVFKKAIYIYPQFEIFIDQRKQKFKELS